MGGVYPAYRDAKHRPLDPNNQLGEGPELKQVLRGALIAAQHLLRERFENRVAWVDGRWQWRREQAVPAPPLPPEARKKIADVSRLFEILTDAQFRDRAPHANHQPLGPGMKPPEPQPGYEQRRTTLGAETRARKPDAVDSTLAVCMLLLFATVIVWGVAGVVLGRDSNRKRVKKLKQRIRGWFSSKATAANEQVVAEPAPPRDDPPPPYFDGSAEPFLPPEGVQGEGGDLPPPYSSCDTQPDCKANSINDQLQNLLIGSTASNMAEICDGGTGATESDVCGMEGGKTDECSANSGREKGVCDRSHVVVV